MLKVNPELGQLRPWNPDQNTPAVEQPLLRGLPRCVTLLISLTSPWLPGHLQPLWYFCPYLSFINHL